MKGITDIHHAIYGHSDLDAAESFYRDFGMVPVGRTDRRLYMRGAGPRQYIYVAELAETPGFLAVAMAVDSMDTLKRFATRPEASAIEEIDAPGGGHRLSLRDPSGFRIDLVHGINSAEPLAMREPLTLNNAEVKRRHAETQRPAKGPAQILRLGHIALSVTDFRPAFEWYTGVLGLLPSDVLYEGTPDNPIGCFMRCDRGDEWVDHHTVAVFQSASRHVHHTSYEVQDFDAQALGNQWLKQRGYRQLWGIGRHVLGSQIFDYWWDTAGNLVEHFTDSDLARGDWTTGYHPVSDAALYQWGPDVPSEFFA